MAHWAVPDSWALCGDVLLGATLNVTKVLYNCTLPITSAIHGNSPTIILQRGNNLLILNNMKEFLTFLYLPVFLNGGLWKTSLGPVAGDEPQKRRSSVDFEPPSAEQFKQNSLVLFWYRNQSRSVLCNEGDILVVVRRSTESVCVFCSGHVWMWVCFQEGKKSSVWMVCRPCAGLWGVDCGVLNHGLLMLCLGIWLCCVPLCLHSLTASLCLSLFIFPHSLLILLFFSIYLHFLFFRLFLTEFPG